MVGLNVEEDQVSTDMCPRNFQAYWKVLILSMNKSSGAARLHRNKQHKRNKNVKIEPQGFLANVAATYDLNRNVAVLQSLNGSNIFKRPYHILKSLQRKYRMLGSCFRIIWMVAVVVGREE